MLFLMFQIFNMTSLSSQIHSRKCSVDEKSSTISGKKFTLAVESLRDLLSGYRRKQEQLLSEVRMRYLQTFFYND